MRSTPRFFESMLDAWINLKQPQATKLPSAHPDAGPARVKYFDQLPTGIWG